MGSFPLQIERLISYQSEGIFTKRLQQCIYLAFDPEKSAKGFYVKKVVQRRLIKMRFFHQNENCRISAILGLRRKLF